MKSRNKKAVSTALIWVGGIVIICIIGAVFIISATTISLSSASYATLGGCQVSLEKKAGFNKNVDAMAKKGKDSTGPDWWEWFALPVAITHLAADALVVDPAIDAGANLVKIEADVCIEEFPDECPLVVGKPSSADLAAECVYKKAVATFYTLQAGQGAKYEKKTFEDRKFNLLKVNVTVDDDIDAIGRVNVSGRCSDYVKSGVKRGEDSEYCRTYVGSRVDYVCAVDFGDYCTIFFNRVTEATMTLTMISRCQRAGSGPEEQQYCKCFANPDVGYETYNGLPNARINYRNDELSKFEEFEKSASVKYTTLLDGAEHPEYATYSGCGVREGLSEIIIDGAKIKGDNIKADDLLVEPGEEKTYYFRLEDTDKDGVGEVIISSKST